MDVEVGLVKGGSGLLHGKISGFLSGLREGKNSMADRVHVTGL